MFLRAQQFNMVERQLIQVATHRNGNSSKRQLTEGPLEDPFTESTVYNRAHIELSKTGLRSSLAALEAEI